MLRLTRLRVREHFGPTAETQYREIERRYHEVKPIIEEQPGLWCEPVGISPGDQHSVIIAYRHESNSLKDIQGGLMRLSQEERDVEVGHIALDILTALKHLESHGMQHRTLSLDSIRLTESQQIRIRDFGLFEMTICGTLLRNRKNATLYDPLYLPPEVLRLGPKGLSNMNPDSNRLHSRGADVWALGVILVQLIRGSKRAYGGPIARQQDINSQENFESDESDGEIGSLTMRLTKKPTKASMRKIQALFADADESPENLHPRKVLRGLMRLNPDQGFKSPGGEGVEEWLSLEGVEIHPKLKDLIRRCVSVDQTKRPTAHGLLSHPFFSEVLPSSAPPKVIVPRSMRVRYVPRMRLGCAQLEPPKNLEKVLEELKSPSSKRSLDFSNIDSMEEGTTTILSQRKGSDRDRTVSSGTLSTTSSFSSMLAAADLWYLLGVYLEASCQSLETFLARKRCLQPDPPITTLPTMLTDEPPARRKSRNLKRSTPKSASAHAAPERKDRLRQNRFSTEGRAKEVAVNRLSDDGPVADHKTLDLNFLIHAAKGYIVRGSNGDTKVHDGHEDSAWRSAMRQVGIAAAGILALKRLLRYPACNSGAVKRVTLNLLSKRVSLPPHLRPMVWRAMLGSDADVEPLYRCQSLESRVVGDEEMAKRLAKFFRQLAVDLPRCHSYSAALAVPEKLRQLKDVLRTWAVGGEGSLAERRYWQGFDSVGATVVLIYQREHEAWDVLERIARRYLRYYLVESSHSCLTAHTALLSQLLGFFDPKLFLHLRTMQVHTDMYAVSWVLTLFTHPFPLLSEPFDRIVITNEDGSPNASQILSSVYPLWDMMLCHPNPFPLFIALGVLVMHRERLMQLDMNGLLSLLSGFPPSDTMELARISRRLFESTPRCLYDWAMDPPFQEPTVSSWRYLRRLRRAQKTQQQQQQQQKEKPILGSPKSSSMASPMLSPIKLKERAFSASGMLEAQAVKASRDGSKSTDVVGGLEGLQIHDDDARNTRTETDQGVISPKETVPASPVAASNDPIDEIKTPVRPMSANVSTKRTSLKQISDEKHETANSCEGGNENPDDDIDPSSLKPPRQRASATFGMSKTPLKFKRSVPKHVRNVDEIVSPSITGDQLLKWISACQTKARGEDQTKQQERHRAGSDANTQSFPPFGSDSKEMDGSDDDNEGPDLMMSRLLKILARSMNPISPTNGCGNQYERKTETKLRKRGSSQRQQRRQCRSLHPDSILDIIPNLTTSSAGDYNGEGNDSSCGNTAREHDIEQGWSKAGLPIILDVRRNISGQPSFPGALRFPLEPKSSMSSSSIKKRSMLIASTLSASFSAATRKNTVSGSSSTTNPLSANGMSIDKPTNERRPSSAYGPRRDRIRRRDKQEDSSNDLNRIGDTEKQNQAMLPRSRSHDAHRRKKEGKAEERNSSDSSRQRPGFSLTSTVTSLITTPLSLVAAGAAAIGGGQYSQTEQTWPFAPGTFVKMAQRIAEERKRQLDDANSKDYSTPNESERDSFNDDSHVEDFPTTLFDARWVVIVGNHQAQAQQVASRLMTQGVSKVTVIRGNGFVKRS